jgi:hypothetical protein
MEWMRINVGLSQVTPSKVPAPGSGWIFTTEVILFTLTQES